MPVNTDGGLIANGEPIGASGLRQIHELVPPTARRGGRRQVPGEPARRLRPALRRARHRGGDDPDDLIPPLSVNAVRRSFRYFASASRWAQMQMPTRVIRRYHPRAHTLRAQ